MPLQTANLIGSGPNGLAAAITLAQRGVVATVYERNATIGGACSTADLTLPGFHHDLGSSVYPLGIASPFFKTLPLDDFGLRWIEPPVPLAHPLDDGSAVTLQHSLVATAKQFKHHDEHAWNTLLASSVRDWPKIVDGSLRPLLSIPRHPAAMATFGMAALLPAQTLAKLVFHEDRTRALFAGCAAHSVLPLTKMASSAAGLVLAASAHTTGWPIVAGGAQALSEALAGYLQSLGGKIVLNAEIKHLQQLPTADATFFDTSVSALSRIAGGALSDSFRTRLRSFKPGPGIFKMDFALSDPIPWRASECSRAATVHLGASFAEIARSEDDMFHGRRNHKPFVLLVQPSLFDASRAPAGKHTAWAYCHVPAGSNEDLTEVLLAQIARFAPDFRDTILAQRAGTAATLSAWDPNLAGGDVSGGSMTLPQLLFRPTAKLYRTSNPMLYLCSASTPPGGGVHGMCGHMAALAALHDHA